MQELEPWVQLLELIDIYYKDRNQPVEIKSVELSAILLDRDNNPVGAAAASKLLYFNNACGTYLKHVADHRPDRVTVRSTNNGKVWTIHPEPSQDPSADPF